MVELIYVPGMKRPVRAATWADVKDFVEESIKKNKKFFDKLADM